MSKYKDLMINYLESIGTLENVNKDIYKFQKDKESLLLTFNKKQEKENVFYLNPNGFYDIKLRNTTEEKQPFFLILDMEKKIEKNKKFFEQFLPKKYSKRRISEKVVPFFQFFFRITIWGAFRKVFLKELFFDKKGKLIEELNIKDIIPAGNEEKLKISNSELQNMLEKSSSYIRSDLFQNEKEIFKKNKELFYEQINRINEYYKGADGYSNNEEEIIKREFLYKIKEETDYHRIKINIDFIGIMQINIPAMEINFDDFTLFYNLNNDNLIAPLCDSCFTPIEKKYFIKEKSIFCPNCYHVCDICNEEFPAEELISTADDKSVCEKDSFQCKECGKFYSKDFSSSLENICLDCTAKCSICSEEALKKDMIYRNEKYYCKSHFSGECDFCGKLLLDEEIYHCEECGDIFCEEHIAKSDFSDKYYCYLPENKGHLKECAVCGKKGVENTDVHSCIISAEKVCSEHFVECNQCNSHFSINHINENGLCDICQAEEKIEISDEIVSRSFKSWNLVLPKSKILRWEFFQVHNIKILLGYSQRKTYRFILDIENNLLEKKSF